MVGDLLHQGKRSKDIRQTRPSKSSSWARRAAQRVFCGTPCGTIPRAPLHAAPLHAAPLHAAPLHAALLHAAPHVVGIGARTPVQAGARDDRTKARPGDARGLSFMLCAWAVGRSSARTRGFAKGFCRRRTPDHTRVGQDSQCRPGQCVHTVERSRLLCSEAQGNWLLVACWIHWMWKECRDVRAFGHCWVHWWN